MTASEPPERSPILPTQPVGDPLPGGYAGLYVNRDPGPHPFSVHGLRVDGDQVDLPAGGWIVPCRPGRHRVTIHAPQGLLLAGADVDVTPDHGAALRFRWSGWSGPFVLDRYGRDVTDPTIADPVNGGPPQLDRAVDGGPLL